ncbi:aryl-alcohol oxidase 2 [Heterobasidion irregulare TC 32-1]|uniref:Aryl-alcohol oxidase 2 n=1 Tax=Heterobasidion irregulare (strain TC 32-1) TaxID=747525 RepID=W4K2J0_HETIT|nr:aryl-alcohol oxidase 2 [Heterobasidion irregulare TC 32-1]ETW79570.1 aryl-alcohol oxidase 2 [Heterobasidion irregulare TC 32-1]
MFSTIWLHLFTTSCIVSNALPALAALLHDPSELPTGKVYDYVIIGSGNAGGVVASRLTEDLAVNVLVIEAGGNDAGDDPVSQRIPVPLMGISLQKSTIDWNFTTTPQRGFYNKTMHYVRGKVLGGSTTLNLLTHTRGSSDDYDRWAQVTSDENWSWDRLEPYMRKLEQLTPSTDGHDISQQIDVSAHGTDGPLSISLPNYSLHVDDLIEKAAHELPNRFPFNKDLNTGSPIGISYNQNAIRNGVRESVASAYIRPALARGDNLDVLLNTQALKLSPTEYTDGKPSFRTVHFATGPHAPVHTVTAKTEVIVSCGSVSTPQLLQLSGIGDAAKLKAVGVEPILNLPDVGQHLQDHALFTQPYVVSEGNPLDMFTQNETFQGEALKEWQETKKGIMGLSFSSQTGWLRLPDDSSIFESTPDPSAGKKSPHFALIFTPTFVTASLKHGSTNGFLTLSNIVASPSSRGSISITTSDPWTQPAIDLNLLTTEFDMFCMKEAVKMSREFLTAPSLVNFVQGPFGGLADIKTDEQLEEYIRKNTGTIHHAVGTARMSSRDSKEGVLNPDLSVKGSHGLRVIDASIFPFLTAAHTMAPVYIIAERGADIVKNAALHANLGTQEPKMQEVLGNAKAPRVARSEVEL